MTTPVPRSHPLVSLELDTDELALGKFLSVTETFFDLLREVTAAVVTSGDVHWVVDAISMSSPVQLAVRPVAASDDVSAGDLDEATAIFVDGVETVQRTESLKPPDAIHLATAENLGAAKFHTYNLADFQQWESVVGMTFENPTSAKPQML